MDIHTPRDPSFVWWHHRICIALVLDELGGTLISHWPLDSEVLAAVSGTLMAIAHALPLIKHPIYLKSHSNLSFVQVLYQLRSPFPQC